MPTVSDYDIVIIGSGPAGQKAAIQGAKANQRVLVIEQARHVGGACVQRGTIPSKTLRESALSLYQLQKCGPKNETIKIRPGLKVGKKIQPQLEVASMMARLDQP